MAFSEGGIRPASPGAGRGGGAVRGGRAAAVSVGSGSRDAAEPGASRGPGGAAMRPRFPAEEFELLLLFAPADRRGFGGGGAQSAGVGGTSGERRAGHGSEGRGAGAAVVAGIRGVSGGVVRSDARGYGVGRYRASHQRVSELPHDSAGWSGPRGRVGECSWWWADRTWWCRSGRFGRRWRSRAGETYSRRQVTSTLTGISSLVEMARSEGGSDFEVGHFGGNRAGHVRLIAVDRQLNYLRTAVCPASSICRSAWTSGEDAALSGR